jgi:hypothetical protein
MAQQFTSRTLTAAVTALTVTALAGLNLASGATGDHAAVVRLQQKVAALTKTTKTLEHEFEEGGDTFRVVKQTIDKVNQHTIALRTPNVVKVVATKPIPANEGATVDALCPTGDQVISGGYIHGAINGIVERAVPIQKPRPGFEVQVLEQGGIGNGNDDSSVTAVAYCVPVGNPGAGNPPAPVVFGAELAGD